MNAPSPRLVPFDIDYARAQIKSLSLGDACAKVAACWIKGCSADAIATLATFDENGGALFRSDIAVFEFDGQEIQFAEAGEGFRRVLGDEPTPENLRNFGNPLAHSERLRKVILTSTGRVVRNKRQLHLADGKTHATDEILLPLADRGPEGASRTLFFIDFGDLPLSARFRDDDFDEPAFSASVDLFRR
jgi:hypothetical protein